MGLKVVQPAQENNCLDSTQPDFVKQRRGEQATLRCPIGLLKVAGEIQVRQ